MDHGSSPQNHVHDYTNEEWKLLPGETLIFKFNMLTKWGSSTVNIGCIPFAMITLTAWFGVIETWYFILRSIVSAIINWVPLLVSSVDTVDFLFLVPGAWSFLVQERVADEKTLLVLLYLTETLILHFQQTGLSSFIGFPSLSNLSPN